MLLLQNNSFKIVPSRSAVLAEEIHVDLHLRYTGNSTIFKNNVVADFVEQRGFSDQNDRRS